MKPFDKTKVKVLVTDKKQAKQFKAILKGLGEPISSEFYLDGLIFQPQDELVFLDGVWVCEDSRDKSEITIKELIHGLSEQEEPKRKFVMKSEDAEDLYEGDDYHGVTLIGEKWEYQRQFPVKINIENLKQNSAWVKAFSTKEAALKWIEEQNKPKELTIQLGMEKAIVSIENGISFYRSYQGASFFGITGEELENIYQAYQQLKGGTNA